MERYISSLPLIPFSSGWSLCKLCIRKFCS